MATPLPEVENLPTHYNELTEIMPYNPHGWYANGPQLEKLIARTKPKCVVELGSWLGESTCHIASCLPKNGKVYAVDHWLGSEEHRPSGKSFKLVGSFLPTLYQQFLSNVIHQGFYHKIIPWKMTTDDAAEHAQEMGIHIDLVYVDAAHKDTNV